MTFLLSFLLLFAVLFVFFYATLPLLERLLKRAAHFTTKFRYRDYLPVLIVLAIGIAATSLAGDAFLDLAESVQEESARLHRADAEVHQWARTAYTSGSTYFFTALTIIGTPVGLGIIVAVIVALLLMRKRWRWAAYLLFTTGVGGLLNLQLKAYFARSRPDLAEALRHASGYSFPSGHAMGATITFGALSYLAFRILPRWRWRAMAVAFSVSMIVAIASSRIYLGVHWISDIAAGIAAGVIWTVTTTVAYEAFRRIRMIRSLRKSRGAAVVLALLFTVAAYGQSQSITTYTVPAQPNDIHPTTLFINVPCGCPDFGRGAEAHVRNGFTIDLPYGGCFSACQNPLFWFELGILPAGTYTIRATNAYDPSVQPLILGTIVVQAVGPPIPALEPRALALLAAALAAISVLVLRRL